MRRITQKSGGMILRLDGEEVVLLRHFLVAGTAVLDGSSFDVIVKGITLATIDPSDLDRESVDLALALLDALG